MDCVRGPRAAEKGNELAPPHPASSGFMMDAWYPRNPVLLKGRI
jgi:hypothetical protein